LNDDAEKCFRWTFKRDYGFPDVNTLHDFIKAKDDEISALEEEIRQANATIKKCCKRIRRFEEQAGHHQRDYEQSEQRAVSLKVEMSRMTDLLGKTRQNDRQI
jgi:peptidoglycan hydrolase CwlO-like protein